MVTDGHDVMRDFSARTRTHEDGVRALANFGDSERREIHPVTILFGKRVRGGVVAGVERVRGDFGAAVNVLA